MRATVKRNGVIFEVEGDTLEKIIGSVSLLQETPEVCTKCGGDAVFFKKEPKGYEYYGVRCVKCGAEKYLHFKKDDKSPYWVYGEEFDKFGKSE